MTLLGRQRDAYYRQVKGDPLELGEQATVGLMLCAATLAGHVGVLEFATTKRSGLDEQGRYGRGDFWAVAPGGSLYPDGWALEIKRYRLTHLTSPKRVAAVRELAWRDAGVLEKIEASERIACSIFYSRASIEGWPCERQLRRELERADWSWRILSEFKELPPLHVLFNARRKAERRTSRSSRA